MDAQTRLFCPAAKVQSPPCIENQWWGPDFLHAGDSWPLQANAASKPESMNCLFCRRPLAIFNLWHKIEARREEEFELGKDVVCTQSRPRARQLIWHTGAGPLFFFFKEFVKFINQMECELMKLQEDTSLPSGSSWKHSIERLCLMQGRCDC